MHDTAPYDKLCEGGFSAPTMHILFCNPVGHGHWLCTQLSKMSSSWTLSFSLLLFDRNICMTRTVPYSRRAWASRLLLLITIFMTGTETIAQYSHLFPCHYMCSMHFHHLSVIYHGYDILDIKNGHHLCTSDFWPCF
jgi:hypothetical protein